MAKTTPRAAKGTMGRAIVRSSIVRRSEAGSCGCSPVSSR